MIISCTYSVFLHHGYLLVILRCFASGTLKVLPQYCKFHVRLNVRRKRIGSVWFVRAIRFFENGRHAQTIRFPRNVQTQVKSAVQNTHTHAPTKSYNSRVDSGPENCCKHPQLWFAVYKITVVR